MINAVPEAEAPEIGIRERWETWKGKKEGSTLSLLRKLASEGLINSKITCYPSSFNTKDDIQPLLEVLTCSYCLQALMAVRARWGASRESNTGWAPRRPTEPCLCVDARREGTPDCLWVEWMKGISQLPEPSLSAQLAPDSKSEVKQVLPSYMIQGQASRGTTQSIPPLQPRDTLTTHMAPVCFHYITERWWLQHCWGLSVVLESLQPYSELCPSVGSGLSTVSFPLNKAKETQKSHRKKSSSVRNKELLYSCSQDSSAYLKYLSPVLGIQFWRSLSSLLPLIMTLHLPRASSPGFANSAQLH